MMKSEDDGNFGFDESGAIGKIKGPSDDDDVVD
jgi:hypothetical protein